MSCSLKKDFEAKETLSNKQHIPWPVCSNQFGLGVRGSGKEEERNGERGRMGQLVETVFLPHFF